MLLRNFTKWSTNFIYNLFELENLTIEDLKMKHHNPRKF